MLLSPRVATSGIVFEDWYFPSFGRCRERVWDAGVHCARTGVVEDGENDELLNSQVGLNT